MKFQSQVTASLEPEYDISILLVGYYSLAVEESCAVSFQWKHAKDCFSHKVTCLMFYVAHILLNDRHRCHIICLLINFRIWFGLTDALMLICSIRSNHLVHKSQEMVCPQLCKGNKILCCLPVPLSAADPLLIFLCVQIAAPCFPDSHTPYVTQRSQRSSDCSRETLPSSSTASATTVAHQPYSYRRASPFRCTAECRLCSNACAK